VAELCLPAVVVTELLLLATVDTTAVTRGLLTGATNGSTTKLSGADLVEVSGNLGDNPTLVEVVFASAGVSVVVLVKLFSQLS